MQGKVKWFSAQKGYGFIIAEDGKDHFMHFRDLAKDTPEDELIEGREVTFESAQGPKGFKATAVKLAGLILALCLLAAGGCSPTQTAWHERGIVGAQNTIENLSAFEAEAVIAVDKEESAFIAGIFIDLKSAKAGKLTRRATTGPASMPATPVILDDDYLDRELARLEAGRAAYTGKRAEIQARYGIAIQNEKYVKECFEQAQRLNAAWAQSSQQLQTQVDQLRDLISQMRTSSAKPRRRRLRGKGRLGDRFRADGEPQGGPGATPEMTPFERLAQAVGETLDLMEDESPAAYAALKRSFGDRAAEHVIKTLQADPALIAQTDVETDIARIIGIIGPAVLKIAMGLAV